MTGLHKRIAERLWPPMLVGLAGLLLALPTGALMAWAFSVACG